jgi:Fe-S-cluster containining protein
MRPVGDNDLIQIVDAALADAARRAGDWLACRPGCTQCCVGVFAISSLDTARLRDGMEELQRTEPARAERVRNRAVQSVRRLRASFPGDISTGTLDESELSAEAFENFANDEPCPALDPETGLCDLYAWRPMTCRTFGPPVRNEGGALGVCELCFHGATDEEIAACEMLPDPDGLEEQLIEQTAEGSTVVAFALADIASSE